MGHQLIGTLPRTRERNEVVEFIADGADVTKVADATVRASEKAFASIEHDPGFEGTVWLITQLATAGRQSDPTEYLESIGITPSSHGSIAELTVSILRVLDRITSGSGRRTDFGELSKMSFVSALVEHIRTRLGPLFSPTAQDIQTSLRNLGKEKQFGMLCRSFFARLTNKCLQYFLSKTLGSQVGEGQRFSTTNQVAQFEAAMETHCNEGAEIVEKFSAEWFSKRFYEDRGDISRKAVVGFGWYAMKKMRDEITRRAKLHEDS